MVIKVKWELSFHLIGKRDCHVDDPILFSQIAVDENDNLVAVCDQVAISSHGDRPCSTATYLHVRLCRGHDVGDVMTSTDGDTDGDECGIDDDSIVVISLASARMFVSLFIRRAPVEDATKFLFVEEVEHDDIALEFAGGGHLIP